MPLPKGVGNWKNKISNPKKNLPRWTSNKFPFQWSKNPIFSYTPSSPVYRPFNFFSFLKINWVRYVRECLWFQPNSSKSFEWRKMMQTIFSSLDAKVISCQSTHRNYLVNGYLLVWTKIYVRSNNKHLHRKSIHVFILIAPKTMPTQWKYDRK